MRPRIPAAEARTVLEAMLRQSLSEYHAGTRATRPTLNEIAETIGRSRPQAHAYVREAALRSLYEQMPANPSRQAPTPRLNAVRRVTELFHGVPYSANSPRARGQKMHEGSARHLARILSGELPVPERLRAQWPEELRLNESGYLVVPVPVTRSDVINAWTHARKMPAPAPVVAPALPAAPNPRLHPKAYERWSIAMRRGSGSGGAAGLLAALGLSSMYGDDRRSVRRRLETV